MRLIRRMSIWVCLMLLTGSANAASVPVICGEWTGSRPPHGVERPTEQKWVLTFRQDMSFALVVFEGTMPVPGLEGAYNASASNVVLQLPDTPPIPLTYSIEKRDMKIAISDLTTMLGWGDGVDKYVRTKEATELPAQAKQRLLKDGQYRLTVILAKDNEDAVLKDLFGDKYKSSLDKPIDGGTFPLRQLQGRNVIQLPQDAFGPPEFNGETLKVFGAVAPKINGEFSGSVVSTTKVKGTFKSRSTTLHGTFTLERVSALESDEQ